MTDKMPTELWIDVQETKLGVFYTPDMHGKQKEGYTRFIRADKDPQVLLNALKWYADRDNMINAGESDVIYAREAIKTWRGE